MGAPPMTMEASTTPTPAAKANVFQKLFSKRGNSRTRGQHRQKKNHAEPLKVASAMPPPLVSSSTAAAVVPPTTKKTSFWNSGGYGSMMMGIANTNNRNSTTTATTTANAPTKTSSRDNADPNAGGPAASTSTAAIARLETASIGHQKQQRQQQSNNSNKTQTTHHPAVLEDNSNHQQQDQTSRTGDYSSSHHQEPTTASKNSSLGRQTTDGSARDYSSSSSRHRVPRRDHPDDDEDDVDAQQQQQQEDEQQDAAAMAAAAAAAGGENSGTIPMEVSVTAQKRLIKERDGFCRRVNRYDGSVIHVEGIASYELGNYLGGGVAGVVYEGQRLLPEASYPVRRGKEQPTPHIDSVGNQQIHGIASSRSILDYVAVPNDLLCTGGGGVGATTTATTNTMMMIGRQQNQHQPNGSAPTTVISVAPHELAREGSVLTTESFANTVAARSVAGNSVALEAVIDDMILIDDQDAPSRSKQMAESLRQNSNNTGGAVDTSFQEAFMEEKVAIKILNPVGFRALATDVTETAVVARPGLALSRDVRDGRRPMTEDHVWWLVNPSSRNLRTLQKYPDAASTPRGVEVDRGSADRGLRISLIAAYKDPKTNKMKELPLNRCIEIWGHVPFDTSDAEFRRIMQSIDKINQGLPPPALPPDRVGTATTTSMDDGSTVDNDVPPSSNKNKNNDGGKIINFFKPPPSPMTAQRTGILKAASTPRKTTYCAELNAYIAIPSVPSKFLKWLRQRRAATKEIRNMMLIGRHRNVVHLFEVLELIQETKSTMFLVLELVQGGELFDLISSNTARIPPVHSIPAGYTAAETAMRKFFVELASGIHYCHANHIAHRDLKPENLLVHNNDDGSCTLKIADFGLSAVFSEDVDGNFDSDTATMSSQLSTPPILAKQQQQQQQRAVVAPAPLQQQQHPISPIKQQMDKLIMAGGAALGFFTCGAVDNIIDCSTAGETGPQWTTTSQEPAPFKRMTSVVGSPHYVAPEIISQQDRRKQKTDDASGQSQQRRGYDGTKADVWSAGVILYAMLFRSLPFGEDLLRCPRYQSFKKWYDDIKISSPARGRRRDLHAALDPVISEPDARDLLGPQWFFPTESSPEARDLVIYMLNPDPDQRPSIQLVLQHPWLLKDAAVVAM